MLKSEKYVRNRGMIVESEPHQIEQSSNQMSHVEAWLREICHAFYSQQGGLWINNLFLF